MTENLYSPIFYLTRGDVVESVHYGSIAIVNAQNELYAWYGNPNSITYLRSTAKPFQALPFVENGGAKTYHLTNEEIALICASHSGTDEHKTVVESIQTKCQIKESDLMCGVHPPGHRSTAQELIRRGEEPTPNRHNCSGKHTGMLAFAKFLGLPYDADQHPYIDPSHPIQSTILETFAEMVGLLPGNVHIGIDGCSAPNFAVPLRNAAFGFARLSDPAELPVKRQEACRTITNAMISNPFMVGGPGSFDTTLMEAGSGKIVCKGGAEGYQGIGIMPGAMGPGSPALGIALKISDGDQRNMARSAVALEILRQLHILSEKEMEALAEFGPTRDLYNYRKTHVGKGFPSFQLKFKA
jgi:L-asparaginase II